MARCWMMAAVLLAASAVSSCATGLEAAEAAPSVQSVASTQVAARRAQTKQAESYLLSGERGLAQARQLAAAGETVAGRTCIMRAQTDAELALLLAPEPTQQDRAQQLLAAVQAYDEVSP